MAILEVWQAKDLRADFVDLWQTRDLAAFLKEAEVCAGGVRRTAWRGDISEASQQSSRPILRTLYYKVALLTSFARYGDTTTDKC